MAFNFLFLFNNFIFIWIEYHVLMTTEFCLTNFILIILNSLEYSAYRENYIHVDSMRYVIIIMY